MEAYDEISNLRALLRKMAQYDPHGTWDHDLIRESNACDHCKLNKKVTKVLWEAQ